MLRSLVSSTNQRMLLLLAGGLAFRVIIAAYLPPGFDEAYYYVYTLHPNWSYFDHPPLVALTTGFGVWLTGTVSQFTIRVGSLLLHTGSLTFLYLTSRTLFTRKAADLTLAIATLIPIFLIGFGVLTLPDSPLMFFWSACLYCAAQEFFGRCPYQPTRRLALLGALVGFACLSKYHGFGLGVGLLCFCGLSDRHRRAFCSPWAAVGASLFLLILTPVLVWNAQHNWISFVYQSNRAVPAQSYQWTQVLVTWLLGIAYLFPLLGVPMWWAIGRSSQQIIASCWTPNSLKAFFLLCLSLPLILGFLYIGGYQTILPTWQMPGFWTTTLLLGNLAATWQTQSPRAVQRWLIGSGGSIALLLLIGLSHVSAGSLQKPNGWFGGILSVTNDASTQLIDIRQLRQGFVGQPKLHHALQHTDFIFTNQIFLAGQVAMAIAPLTTAPLTCFSNDLRGFAFWSSPETWLGKNALYITSARFENESNDIHPYRNYFQSIQSLGEISIQRGGVPVEIFKVFQAKNLRSPYPRSALTPSKF